MALTLRQIISFRDRCLLFRPVDEIDEGSGRVVGKRYDRITPDPIPCHWEVRQSAGGPEIYGRVEAANAFSRDLVHFDGEQDIGSDDVALNLSFDAGGFPGKNYGSYWVAQWEAKNYANRGNRRARKRVWEGIRIETPPEGVPHVSEI